MYIHLLLFLFFAFRLPFVDGCVAHESVNNSVFLRSVSFVRLCVWFRPTDRPVRLFARLYIPKETRRMKGANEKNVSNCTRQQGNSSKRAIVPSVLGDVSLYTCRLYRQLSSFLPLHPYISCHPDIGGFFSSISILYVSSSATTNNYNLHTTRLRLLSNSSSYLTSSSIFHVSKLRGIPASLPLFLKSRHCVETDCVVFVFFMGTANIGFTHFAQSRDSPNFPISTFSISLSFSLYIIIVIIRRRFFPA